MGWFSSSSSSRHHSSSRPGYARSWAGGSTYSSSSRHHSSTSRYKRSPREGYIQYLWHKFKHLMRQLWSYARRHPFKVFFMVIMPLISGGVLTKVARQLGVNIPEGASGAAGGARGGAQGGYYGSEGYGGGERGGEGGGGGGLNIQSVASGIGGLASLAKMAQSFM